MLDRVPSTITKEGEKILATHGNWVIDDVVDDNDD